MPRHHKIVQKGTMYYWQLLLWKSNIKTRVKKHKSGGVFLAKSNIQYPSSYVLVFANSWGKHLALQLLNSSLWSPARCSLRLSAVRWWPRSMKRVCPSFFQNLAAGCGYKWGRGTRAAQPTRAAHASMLKLIALCASSYITVTVFLGAFRCVTRHWSRLKLLMTKCLCHVQWPC